MRVFTQIRHFELIMRISLYQIQKWIIFRQILPESNPLIYLTVNKHSNEKVAV